MAYLSRPGISSSHPRFSEGRPGYLFSATLELAPVSRKSGESSIWLGFTLLDTGGASTFDNYAKQEPAWSPLLSTALFLLFDVYVLCVDDLVAFLPILSCLSTGAVGRRRGSLWACLLLLGLLVHELGEAM